MNEPPTPSPRDIEDNVRDEVIRRQKQLARSSRSWVSPSPSVRSEASPPLPRSAKLKTRFGPRPGYLGRPNAFHVGLDFEAAPGTPVLAVRPGTAMLIVRDEWCVEGFVGYGNVVVLYHPDDDLWSFYGHLETIHVRPGAAVEAGQVIGRIGNTTNGRLISMGFRLHFEVRFRGTDGLPPFPGPTLLNNRDPEQWLESLGIWYDAEGRMKVGDRRVA